MTSKRKFAVGIDEFQHSFYSCHGLLYVKVSPDNPPLRPFSTKNKGGVIWRKFYVQKSMTRIK